MYKLILAATTALAVSACTYSQHGPSDDRSVESAGLVASANVDVTGDAEFAGMIVNARGDVARNLDLAGATVRSNAHVGGNLTAAGARVNFTGSVNGNADVAGATTHLDADIRGNLTIAGARVTIDGTLQGELEAHAARIWLKGDFMSPVRVIGEGTEASGRAYVEGYLAEGGLICATEVEIRRSARIEGPLTIVSDARPDADGVPFDYVDLDGRDCDKMDI